MSSNRLNPGALSAQDLSDIKSHLDAIEQIIKNKIIDFTVDDRRKYGSVNETNKLFINKIETVIENYPDMLPPRFDIRQFKAEKEQRELLEKEIGAMDIVSYQLQSAKIANDFNNYKAALSVYAYVQFMSEQYNDTTATQLILDLKEFFPRSRNED